MRNSIIAASLLSLATTSTIAAELKSEQDKLGYAFGYRTGQSALEQEVEINPDTYVEGFKDGMTKKQSKLSDEEMEKVMLDHQKKQMAKMEEKRQSQAKDNLAAGNKFLESNKKKNDIKVMDNGIQYQVLNSGKGKSPNLDDYVSVHYHGTLISGDTFDSSIERGQPAIFPLKGVIQGWQDVLQVMKPGDVWKVYIPPKLAYGEYGQPPKIEPNTTLIFEIRLLSILPEKEAMDKIREQQQARN